MIVQVNLVAVTVYFLILDETDTNDSIVAIEDQLTGKSLFGELTGPRATLPIGNIGLHSGV